jgi:hypothetical protein
VRLTPAGAIFWFDYSADEVSVITFFARMALTE